MADPVRGAQAFVRWSDGDASLAAIALAERHRDLMSGRLSPSQLAGLHAIAQAARDTGQLIGYARNQATRAQHAGRFEVERFWRDLVEVLEKAVASGPAAGPASAVRILQELIQHLVPHCLYLRARDRSR